MELGALGVFSLDFSPHMPGPTLEKWISELKPQFVKKKKNLCFFPSVILHSKDSNTIYIHISNSLNAGKTCRVLINIYSLNWEKRIRYIKWWNLKLPFSVKLGFKLIFLCFIVLHCKTRVIVFLFKTLTNICL